MSVQSAEPRINPRTGRRYIEVHSSTDVLQIAVVPDSGNRDFELVDEYGFANFAYYRLVLHKPPKIVCHVTPITDDGSVGCQSVPEFPLSASERSNWDERDNADNAAGNAFRSYAVGFEAPPALGLGFTISLERWIKYYYSIKRPNGAFGHGKYDRFRPLTVEVIAQGHESFAAYAAARFDAINAGDMAVAFQQDRSAASD